MAVGVLAVVMAVNAAFQWRAAKRAAKAAEERRLAADERRKQREQALLDGAVEGGDVSSELRDGGGVRRRQSLDGQSEEIEMH